MDVATFNAHVQGLPFGKRLPQATYIYAPDVSILPADLARLVERLRDDLRLTGDFNVLKFTHDGGVSFLKYPGFHDLPHPELSESVRISLVTGKVSRSRYGADCNPPILHRKETLVPADHPSAPIWARLTAQEESAGLYDHSVAIGFKATWQGLLRDKSLTYRGHDLIEAGSGDSVEPQSTPVLIHRHRTAMYRTGLSKPVRLALEAGVIAPGMSVFDYGCGRGSDAEILRDLGYTVGAWDPAFFPDEPKIKADVVNLGYVLNVIETPRERLEVLLDAWGHATQSLVVSTLIKGQEGHSRAQAHSDGIVTSRRTFQKYFEQGELQGVLEAALDAEAHAISLGIFVVFRETGAAQSFLEARRRRSVDWTSVSRRRVSKKSSRLPRIAMLYEAHASLLDDFWTRALELGRVPEKGEFAREIELRECAGSPASVLKMLLSRHGEAAFEEAARRRREDLLVYLALSGFRKQIPQKSLAPQLQRDLSVFFGSYAKAQAAGVQLLMSLKAENALWEIASTLSFGWLDPAEKHFVIHNSLLERLPPELRVFVECGALLYGDPREADLIKLHLGSRKVSFLIYDDFLRRPFPELRARIKVDLVKLQVAVFEYGCSASSQVLCFKERFVGADFPDRARMEQVSRRLEMLGIQRNSLGSNDNNAPSKEAFDALLERYRLRPDLKKRGAPKSPEPT